MVRTDILPLQLLLLCATATVYHCHYYILPLCHCSLLLPLQLPLIYSCELLPCTRVPLLLPNHDGRENINVDETGM